MSIGITTARKADIDNDPAFDYAKFCNRLLAFRAWLSNDVPAHVGRVRRPRR
jgi:hypothetical protein